MENHQKYSPPCEQGICKTSPLWHQRVFRWIHIHVDVLMVLWLVRLVFKMIILALLPYMSVNTHMYMDMYTCTPKMMHIKYCEIRNGTTCHVGDVALRYPGASKESSVTQKAEIPIELLSIERTVSIDIERSRANVQCRKRSSDSETSGRASAFFGHSANTAFQPHQPWQQCWRYGRLQTCEFQ
jgi:hypothetical protein